MPVSVFLLPSPATSGRTGDGTGGKFESCKIKSDSIPFLYQTISHTFCPECFVRRPACIFTVLSAWKLRKRP
ncbi:unnamed protein product [Staurois parvus]|uniref:Uncharacterized protein n=1 Tax=Staurois parvus TaxID=386267 RepID=A0ABN9HIA1_9NEOB|nr:unnamed protein product [Staurois parvus]